MDINSLAIDIEAVQEGRWVGDLPEMGDLRLRVRGFSSPKVQALRARKLRALPKKDRERDGQPKFEAALRVTAEVLHEAVLLDWEGLTDGNKPLPYDADLARQWLTDARFQRFADAVATAAQIVDNGEAEATEELAGN